VGGGGGGEEEEKGKTKGGVSRGREKIVERLWGEVYATVEAGRDLAMG